MHLDKHTIERKYKCHECDESFRRSMELKSHMKSHGIGIDKLHKCSICTKPFRFKEHLTVSFIILEVYFIYKKQRKKSSA